MSLRILIVAPYYPAYLKYFYAKYPKTTSLPYQKHRQRLLKELFGLSDFLSDTFTKLGNPAEDIVLNDRPLQEQWLKENTTIFLSLKDKFQDLVIKHVPIISGKISQNWELKVFDQQIKKFKPDIIYSHNIGYIDPNFLFSIKPKVKLIAGQIACPVAFPWKNFKPYDVIITSFPHYLDKLGKKGIKTEYLPLAFQPSVLKKVPPQKRVYDLTFIGGISRAHKKGFNLLNQLAEKIKIDVWGYGKEELDPKSKLYQYHHGEAWGKEVYRRMLQSKITINRHIDVAENNANNLRLYEATGCGAMLITDQKDNLNKLFKVGQEVITYQNADDLIKKAKYYLKHDQKRKKIAKAGQKRTLKDHNYQIRMTQLLEILKKYI